MESRNPSDYAEKGFRSRRPAPEIGRDGRISGSLIRAAQ
jgi:hypothetical protein